MKKFTVGVIQMDSQDNVEKNLQTAVEFIGEAAARGGKADCNAGKHELCGDG